MVLWLSTDVVLCTPWDGVGISPWTGAVAGTDVALTIVSWGTALSTELEVRITLHVSEW